MTARTSYTAPLRVGAPAAVIGALAASIAVTPAHAQQDAPAARGAELKPLSARQPAATPAPAAAALVPLAARPSKYTVKRGDTVYAIATRYGLRTSDVLAWNGLTWRSVIYPGQKLRLSSASSSTSKPKPPTTSPSGTSKVYTVKRGDTVYAIAKKYGTTVSAIVSANGLGRSALIYPGQKLRIGGSTSTAKPKPPSTGKPSTGNSNSGKPSSGKVHVVKRGDTVYAIAKKYGTTINAIISANGLGRNALIYPGQKLRVSGSTATPTQPPTKPTNPKPTTPPSAKTHLVVAGDTLFDIAKKYDITVSELLRANGLSSNSIIYPGQTLLLTAPAEPAQRYATLDATQKAHAAHIIRVGRELGISDRGIAIALATAMVESSMRNLDYGDRDSLGLFQQRPSQGWGTAAQILDADRSIRVFYGGPQDPNGRATRGLLDISGWQNMSFTGAAQAVQISAYPDRYGQWEQQSFRWLASL
ncbi:LysM peptidoglycan-binding domain-containing protein [Microbacterium esteraromaticum]|uniref:muramidase family protein n=1 Tax=Microbacterium esteraromaticum TaxID=57043 RepID=UPI001CD1F7D1|nr:LysM peptidoglycan-binding domain-containing protein [Microbacterium esteraromaticum]MCA1308028.1 LysM peptidoglycan-binding domain-containing protein [Microbacterium esteraromaticum]